MSPLSNRTLFPLIYWAGTCSILVVGVIQPCGMDSCWFGSCRAVGGLLWFLARLTFQSSNLSPFAVNYSEEDKKRWTHTQKKLPSHYFTGTSSQTANVCSQHSERWCSSLLCGEEAQGFSTISWHCYRRVYWISKPEWNSRQFAYLSLSICPYQFVFGLPKWTV